MQVLQTLQYSVQALKGFLDNDQFVPNIYSMGEGSGPGHGPCPDIGPGGPGVNMQWFMRVNWSELANGET